MAQTLRDLERLGHYGDIVLRSDGEPALVDLMKEIAKGRGNRRTVIEHSAPGDSQGNGFIERGVRSVEEMARVLKLDLEHRLTTRLEVTHPVFAWLVEHAVDLHNKFLVGSDGKTAYERLKGKKYHGEVLPFASPVMLRVSGKVLGGVVAERWYEGVWLGKRFHTEEHLVARATDGVVVRTRSVQSLPNAISMDLLNKIVGAPWAPTGVMKGNQEVVCPARLRPEDPVEIYEPFVPQNMKITKAIISKFGYSRRCPRCRALTQGEASTTLAHSRECRERIEQQIRSDSELKTRLEAAEERKTRYLAGEVERFAQATGHHSSPVGSEEIGTKRRRTVDQADTHVEPDINADELMEDVGELPVPTSSSSSSSSSSETQSASPSTLPHGQTRSLPDDAEQDSRETSRRRLNAVISDLHSVTHQFGEEGLKTQWYDDQHWIEEFCEAGPDEMPYTMVAKAKQEEMERFARMKVYEVVQKHEVDHENSVVIGSRWVITNKGTPEKPVAKARLVAQEFADNTLRDELFAGTPNLTSVKYLLSRLCTRSHVEFKQDKVLMLLDVKSAFIYGTCRRSVYIRLPPEDTHASRGDCYGRLLKAMYGTRDAPQVWQDRLRLVMERLPGVYFNKSTGIEVATHVDDFLVVGYENVLKDFYKALLK